MRKPIKRKKRTDWKRILLTCLCVFLSVVLVAAVAVTIFLERVWSSLDQMSTLNTETLSPEQIESLRNETQATEPGFSGVVVDPNDITTPPPPEYVITGENIINIMLIGQDRREGEARARSDVMLLLTINKAKRTMTFTSFMRDMYVEIPGVGGDKMNAAYQWGGMPLLNRTLSRNFGIEVDGNVEVDFEGFMEVIDILGGVDIELSAAEVEHLNELSHDPTVSDTPWSLKEGVNHLDGSQALAYSRLRYVRAELGDDSPFNYADFGRTGRQRQVMLAMFQRLLSMGLSDINKVMPLLNKVTQNVATDMSKETIVQYVVEVLPILGELKIQNLRIPADYTFYDALVGNKDVLMPNLKRNQDILRETLE